MITLYGIPNCDTIKKARRWLETNGVDYQFHDFRKDGLTKKTIEDWLKQLDWEVLLNKRGTTYRNLPDADKQDLSKAKAIALMLQYPALIKRPVWKIKQKHLIGFGKDNEAEIKALLKT